MFGFWLMECRSLTAVTSTRQGVDSYMRLILPGRPHQRSVTIAPVVPYFPGLPCWTFSSACLPGPGLHIRPAFMEPLERFHRRVQTFTALSSRLFTTRTLRTAATSFSGSQLAESLSPILCGGGECISRLLLHGPDSGCVGLAAGALALK